MPDRWFPAVCHCPSTGGRTLLSWRHSSFAVLWYEKRPMVFCYMSSHGTYYLIGIPSIVQIPPRRFSLANSVIFWVLHENSVFELNIGIDKQIPWSPTPISLLFLCIFPYQNSQPVKRSSLQSVCSSLVFLIFPRTLPHLWTVLSIF